MHPQTALKETKREKDMGSRKQQRRDKGEAKEVFRKDGEGR